MRISRLIEQLQDMESIHGDVAVMIPVVKEGVNGSDTLSIEEIMPMAETEDTEPYVLLCDIHTYDQIG